MGEKTQKNLTKGYSAAYLTGVERIKIDRYADLFAMKVMLI